MIRPSSSSHVQRELDQRLAGNERWDPHESTEWWVGFTLLLSLSLRLDSGPFNKMPTIL